MNRIWMHSPSNHSYGDSLGERAGIRLGWLLGFHSPSLIFLDRCPCTRHMIQRMKDRYHGR